MRIFKFIISIIILTLASLLYVHQQVELVKLSYAIDYKEKKLEHALDRKEALRYNIKQLEDPSRLEKILIAKKIDVSFPKKGQVVNAYILSSNTKSKIEGSVKSAGIERKTNIFKIFEFFGLRAEAQAKER